MHDISMFTSPSLLESAEQCAARNRAGAIIPKIYRDNNKRYSKEAEIASFEGLSQAKVEINTRT